MDNRIVFIPSEAVSFKSLTQKQTVQLIVKNNWDRSIVFKMKTTRPLLFKMRPVYGLIGKGNEQTIRLLFKGFGEKEKPPCSRDRFTIVVAPAPENCIDPSRVWKQMKCPEVLNQTARKILRIEYGENDNSKVVSVRPKAEPKTAEELELLRKQYPDIPEPILQQLPSPTKQKSTTPASKYIKPDLNNNNNKVGKKTKDTTEDSSSTSSENK